MLIEKLKEKLVDWEDGEEGGERGREKARAEMERLKKTPFGVDLLRTIGYVYKYICYYIFMDYILHLCWRKTHLYYFLVVIEGYLYISMYMSII